MFLCLIILKQKLSELLSHFQWGDTFLCNQLSAKISYARHNSFEKRLHSFYLIKITRLISFKISKKTYLTSIFNTKQKSPPPPHTKNIQEADFCPAVFLSTDTEQWRNDKVYKFED